jgi:hypothetical protein
LITLANIYYSCYLFEIGFLDLLHINRTENISTIIHQYTYRPSHVADYLVLKHNQRKRAGSLIGQYHEIFGLRIIHGSTLYGAQIEAKTFRFFE